MAAVCDASHVLISAAALYTPVTPGERSWTLRLTAVAEVAEGGADIPQPPRIIPV